MRVEDALLQLQLVVKRAAKTVYQVLSSANSIWTAAQLAWFNTLSLSLSSTFFLYRYLSSKFWLHCRWSIQPVQMQHITTDSIQIVSSLVTWMSQATYNKWDPSTISHFVILFFFPFFLVAEAFVGKGVYFKQVSYHAKGRSGIMERPQCRLTVVVRETTPEEEAKIAKLRVSNFKKLTRRERQLMPHKLIETTPKWSRRRKEAAATAA